MKDKVAFWGAGAYASRTWKQMKKLPFFNDQYIAFIDKNKELWGSYLDFVKIVAPSSIDKMAIDIFVIMSDKYGEEIKNYIIYEIGIREEKVYLFDEYKRRCYAQWIYLKSGMNLIKKKERYFDLKNIVIYTAITGGYDDLKEPLFVDDSLTYVCFTDNHQLKSNIWNIEYVRSDGLDKIYLAKKYKMKPHEYFKEFETSIWVDGKFEIQNDLREYIKIYEKNEPILCFPHFERDCIYDEAITCLYQNKGNKQKIIGQISEYYRMNYPFSGGLYEMGCIVRKHNDDFVKKLMNDWLQETMIYSSRDQLSFPVMCWKNKFHPDICDLYIGKNKWLKVYLHNY